MHGGCDDVVVRAADPLVGGRKHQLQHALVWVVVLLRSTRMDWGESRAAGGRTSEDMPKEAQTTRRRRAAFKMPEDMHMLWTRPLTAGEAWAAVSSNGQSTALFHNVVGSCGRWWTRSACTRTPGETAGISVQKKVMI